MSWFTRIPHRLALEINSLEAAGVYPIVDEEAKGKGVLKMEFTITGDNPLFGLPNPSQNIQLIVIYPDLFPKFRPLIKAPDLNLPRHQSPLDKNLCLLGRRTENWMPETTIGELLQTQLRKVLTKGVVVDKAVISADETEQAEPYAELITSSHNPVLADLSFLGYLKDYSLCEEVATFKAGIPSGATVPTQLVITTLDGIAGYMYDIPEVLAINCRNRIEGVLFYVDERPPADARVSLRWLGEKLKRTGTKLKLPNKPMAVKNGSITNVVGFIFADELEKGKEGLNLMFLIEWTSRIGDGRGGIRKDLPAKTHKTYVRSMDIGLNKPAVRVPQLQTLRQKKVGVFGLGALGGFVSIELGRNGVGELRVLDGDVVDNETSIRWPLGMAYAGWNKAEAVKHFLKINYPGTVCNSYVHTIGGYRIDENGNPVDGINEQDGIETILDGLSLVVDATAEFGVHHYLSIAARNKGIPYICLSATPGGYGGLVCRTVPAKSDACWKCLKFWQSEDGYEEWVPKGDETAGWIQPPGCADVTFTGTAFDLQQIALMGVRLAVSTLCMNDVNGYKDVPWDVAILNLFDESRNPIAPEWKTFVMEAHKDCDHK